MSDATLTPDRILDVAEDVLRRYGPIKTTVSDIARALGVSHGAIYRHFSSKAVLQDAVTERWLHRVSAPLSAIAQEDGPGIDRLRRWLDRLIAIKRQKVRDDPELFATYHALAEEAREVVHSHVQELVEQLTRIIESGIAQGEFNVPDPLSAAKGTFNATSRFHHPAHAAEWTDANIDTDFAQVWRLVLAGLVHGGDGDQA